MTHIVSTYPTDRVDCCFEIDTKRNTANAGGTVVHVVADCYTSHCVCRNFGAASSSIPSKQKLFKDCSVILNLTTRLEDSSFCLDRRQPLWDSLPMAPPGDRHHQPLDSSSCLVVVGGNGRYHHLVVGHVACGALSRDPTAEECVQTPDFCRPGSKSETSGENTQWHSRVPTGGEEKKSQPVSKHD